MALIINGRRIEQSEIEHVAERMQQQGGRPPAPGPNADIERLKMLENAKKRIIERELIEGEARENGPKLPAEKLEEEFQAFLERQGGEKEFIKKSGLKKSDLPKVKKDIELRMRMDATVRQVIDAVDSPNDETVLNYYESNQKEFTRGGRIKAAHIVMHVNEQQDKKAAQAKIEQVRARLDAGEDFAKVADSGSDCPGSGGDLGWFPRGQMVEEFENVVFNMKPGEVSGVFETPFGFHIARVDEVKPDELIPFDDAKEKIRDRLLEEYRHEAFEEFLERLEAKATIEEV